MKARKTLLAASAVLALVSLPALAAERNARPIQLAQADDTATTAETPQDPVALAEQAVEEARAALRKALATGDGIPEARQNLRAALATLDAARNGGEDPGIQPTEQPPAQEEQQPPAEEQATPPAQEEQQQAPAEQEQAAPPVPEEQTPPVVEEPAPTPPPQEEPAAPETEQPPAAEQTQPEQPAPEPPAPAETEQQAAPQPEQQAAPQQQDQPQTQEAAPQVELPPPPETEEAPPPPPPEAKEGAFDLNKFKVRPKFGQAPKNETATPPPALQQSEDAVKEGATIAAPDGRVIVKEQGQVTVLHDDVSRLRQRGDKVEQQKTENDTRTTTVTRPDGTEIVTVRDRSGNIVQRYRKLPDGTVQVMIGEVEQPGLVGRIFGKGPQVVQPKPRRPNLRLNLGPLQVQIPQDQYIVDMSRADEQQLQTALSAPPVERVERAYSLEEIRRSGRLRDKVRRIDFDTITFDTNQATINDSQVPKMQAIGDAIRAVIDKDPTQVFLIEGHTDAVGTDLYNLALSDRRAETVAEVLSYYFGIPPENLITQGYGEQFLKVPTVEANRENRRVAFRNITPLLRASDQ